MSLLFAIAHIAVFSSPVVATNNNTVVKSTKVTTQTQAPAKSLLERRSELFNEATNLALSLQNGSSVTVEVDEVAFSLRSEQEEGMDAAVVRLTIKKRGDSSLRLSTQYVVFIFKNEKWETIPDIFYVKK